MLRIGSAAFAQGADEFDEHHTACQLEAVPGLIRGVAGAPCAAPTRRRVWSIEVARNVLATLTTMNVMIRARMRESLSGEIELTARTPVHAYLDFVAFRFLFKRTVPPRMNYGALLHWLRWSDMYGCTELFNLAAGRIAKLLARGSDAPPADQVFQHIEGMSLGLFDTPLPATVISSLSAEFNVFPAAWPTVAARWCGLEHRLVRLLLLRNPWKWPIGVRFQLLRLWIEAQPRSQAAVADRLLTLILPVLPWTELDVEFFGAVVRVQEHRPEAHTMRKNELWRQLVILLDEWFLRREHGRRMAVADNGVSLLDRIKIVDSSASASRIDDRWWRGSGIGPEEATAQPPASLSLSLPLPAPASLSLSLPPQPQPQDAPARIEMAADQAYVVWTASGFVFQVQWDMHAAGSTRQTIRVMWQFDDAASGMRVRSSSTDYGCAWRIELGLHDPPMQSIEFRGGGSHHADLSVDKQTAQLIAASGRIALHLRLSVSTV